jgi:uncharacterized protein YjbI with pentapeptide repeats
LLGRVTGVAIEGRFTMDRGEALKLLRGGGEGVAEWNRLREFGEEIPKLRGVKLRARYPIETNLRGINLSGVDLSGADLSFTSLCRSDFSGSDLSDANLIGADLSECRLRRTNLSNSKLSGANLERADLGLAVICNAKLAGANLRAARCCYTRLADVDLSEVRGLDSVEHSGPSTIGMDTLCRSRGEIPETFLRGCGLPERAISFLHSLVNSMEPIQLCSCFISFSSKDEEFAQRLQKRMRKENLQVWCARERITEGRKVREEIDRAKGRRDKLLLILSKASMGSDWIGTELHTALSREQSDRGQSLVPISLSSAESLAEWKCCDAETGKDMAEDVRTRKIVDFSNWRDDGALEVSFARLLENLKAEESIGTGDGSATAAPPQTLH